MESVYAQTLNINGTTVEGPLQGVNSLADIVNKITAFLIPLSTVILFLYLAWGGFEFLTSLGDQKKIEAGKAKITASLIGFLLLITSYAIVNIIATIFGLSGAGFGK